MRMLLNTLWFPRVISCFLCPQSIVSVDCFCRLIHLVFYGYISHGMNFFAYTFHDAFILWYLEYSIDKFINNLVGDTHVHVTMVYYLHKHNFLLIIMESLGILSHFHSSDAFFASTREIAIQLGTRCNATFDSAWLDLVLPNFRWHNCRVIRTQVQYCTVFTILCNDFHLILLLTCNWGLFCWKNAPR